MSGSRKNTLVFWQQKNKEDSFGGGPHLYSIDEADYFKKANNDRHLMTRYQSVTLTDEELAQIADEKSEIKDESLLEKFNPFSPQGIAYKKEKELFAAQKTTFVLGLSLKDSEKQNGQNTSLLKSVLRRNSLFDPNAV